MATKKWFPASREEQYALIRKTVSFMDDPDKRTVIGFAAASPNGIWYDTDFTPKYRVYDTVLRQWISPATRTILVVANLRDAEKAFFPLYRTFYAMVRVSPLVTGGLLEGMGFPPRPSGKHSSHPVDKLFVNINAMPVGNYTVKVTFENRDTGSSAVPDYLTGVVLYYRVGDAPVTNPDSLDRSRLATRSPYRFDFDPSQQGLTASLAGRFQNQRGELGPWSNIISIIIP
jgi:hypothetical protein